MSMVISVDPERSQAECAPSAHCGSQYEVCYRTIADIRPTSENALVSAQYRFGWLGFFASSAALAFALAREWIARATGA